MTKETPPGSCERIALLLSLRVDDAATPAQFAEIDAHLPLCEACRRAAAVDVAVRARLVERTSAAAPSWLEGFAERTTSRAFALAREARSQDRLLLMSAAAAVLVAVTAQFAWPGSDSTSESSGETAAVREAARTAVMRPPRLARADEGK